MQRDSRISLEAFIQSKYERLLRNSGKISYFTKLINNSESQLFIFGGWVRNCVYEHFYSKQLSSGDVDFVIDGKIDEVKISKELSSQIEINRFSGFKVQLDENQIITFWELDKSFVFRRGIFPVSLSNLLRGTVFTVNSILFSTKTYQLIDYLAIRDISQKVIRFNCKEYLDVFSELQIFRAVQLQRYQGYRLDNLVKEFISDQLKKISLKEFADSILKHNKPVSREYLKQMYVTLKKQF